MSKQSLVMILAVLLVVFVLGLLMVFLEPVARDRFGGGVMAVVSGSLFVGYLRWLVRELNRREGD